MKSKIFWKYTDINRIDSVINGLFRFTQPGALNDPFDARPEIDAVINNDTLNKYFRNLSRKQFEEIFTESISQPQLKSMQITQSTKDLVYSMITDGKLDLLEGSDFSAALFLKSFEDAMDRRLGIFCLSETNDNILMWSHYGAQHKGIAIGLDASHPFFNSSGKSREFKIGKIKYTPKRPKNLNDFGEQYKIFYQKSPDWRYEREWRVISSLDKAKKVINSDTEYPTYLFAVPLEAIHSVIFGMKASKHEIFQARKAIIMESTIPRFQVNAKDISFFQAVKHPTLFRVNIEELK